MSQRVAVDWPLLLYQRLFLPLLSTNLGLSPEYPAGFVWMEADFLENIVSGYLH